ncbi:MAG TPA: hypothetical protein VGG03_01555 [Thermoanaerobaculia bacterium]|jgi:hypothetical protein
MSYKAFRRAAATLLIATFATLTCAAPSHASRGFGRRAFDGPTPSAPERGFIAFLLRLFDLAGGAMDPNGKP